MEITTKLNSEVLQGIPQLKHNNLGTSWTMQLIKIFNNDLDIDMFRFDVYDNIFVSNDI